MSAAAAAAAASASRSCSSRGALPRQLLVRGLSAAARPSGAALGAGVRRPLVVGGQQQLQQRLQLGSVRHSTIWRKVQEGIQGKQAEKEGTWSIDVLGGSEPSPTLGLTWNE